MPPKAGRKFRQFFEVPRDLVSRKGIGTRATEGSRHVWFTSGTIIVGDDTGLIKIVSVKGKGKVLQVWGEQNPNRRIKRLYWHTHLKEKYMNNNFDLMARQKEFVAVLSNGDIQVYDTLSGAHKTVIRGEKDFMGLYVMQSYNEKVAWTADKNGYLRLWSTTANPETWKEDYHNGTLSWHDHWTLNRLPPKRPLIQKEEVDPENDKFANLLRSQAKRKGKHNDRGVLLSEFRATTRNVPKASILCMKGHPNPQFPWIAVAGLNRPPEVYDIHRQKMVYRGRHSRHWLGHQFKLTVSDLEWSISRGGGSHLNPCVVIACTKQSNVIMYDIRANNGKAILSQKLGEYTLNRMKLRTNEDLTIADGNANLWDYQWRKPIIDRGGMYRRYCGFVGAVTDFEMHPTRDLIASVGLGRKVVLHDVKTPRLPHWRYYLKQKLTACLFSTIYELQYTKTWLKKQNYKFERRKAKRKLQDRKQRQRRRELKERQKARIKAERKGEAGYTPDGDRLDGEEDEDMENDGVFEEDSDPEDGELIDGKPNPEEANPNEPTIVQQEDNGEEIDIDQFEVDEDGNYDFDGYDTDEMRDLLKSLRSEPKEDEETKSVKKKKSKPLAKTLRKVMPEWKQKKLESKKKKWFDDDENDENWDCF